MLFGDRVIIYQIRFFEADAAVQQLRLLPLGVHLRDLLSQACSVVLGLTGQSQLLTPALIPVAIGVAILSTALPYTLEMVALTRLPARTFGTLMSIEPAFGALSGLFFLHEHLSLAQWLAITCIILASVGATLTMRNESKPLVPAD